MRRRSLLFALLFALATTSFGQSTRGVITGRVADSTGAVVQGAKVQLSPSGLSTPNSSPQTLALLPLASS